MAYDYIAPQTGVTEEPALVAGEDEFVSFKETELGDWYADDIDDTQPIPVHDDNE